MATKNPDSRFTEGDLNTPYVSPNGVTEGRGNGGSTVPGASTPRSEQGARYDESAGEKIGRFFRRAMDRLAGREEGEVDRGGERNRRDREMRDRVRERSRPSDRSWQVGRPSLRDRDQSEWRDLGRSPDERNPQSRAGFSGERGTPGYGTGRPYGQGQESYGQRSEREESRYGQRTDAGPSFAWSGQGYESRGGQTLGERTLGRSPGESYGRAEPPEIRPYGDRSFQGERGRDEWDRDREGWNRGRDERQSGARGAFHALGGTIELGPDEERAGDWGEVFRARDRGEGRRFWQREPLAARDVMTRNPKTVARDSSIREAAVIMRDENCGVVPVVDVAGRLEGILTDRDNVVRGVVKESFHQLRVEDVMTDDVSAVTEDEPLTSVLDLMGRKQVRRVPVVDRDDRLLGIISMADIANRADYDEDLQDAFERISSRRSFWSVFS